MLRQNSIVKFDFSNMPVDYHKKYPFAELDMFVYLGEIVQMPGHCIVARMKDGKVFCGYHIDEFVEVPEEC